MFIHAGSGKRLHPLTALLVVAWSFASIYQGLIAGVLVLAVLLTVYSGLLRRLAWLYAWITIPVIIILALTIAPEQAVIAGLKLLALIMATTSTLVMINPLELGYVIGRMRLPPIAGFVIPITIRIADYMAGSLWEARAAMKGRGISGRFKQLLLLPIPLIVHSFNVSLYVAEALSFKYPTKTRSWLEKPKAALADTVIIVYIITATLLNILVR